MRPSSAPSCEVRVPGTCSWDDLALVGGGLFDVVDHDVVDGAAGCGEAQAELGGQRFEECGKVALLGWESVGGRVGWKDGAEAESEVVVAGEAGLVDDGAAVVLQEPERETR